jgi:hypothetical protein
MSASLDDPDCTERGYNGNQSENDQHLHDAESMIPALTV